MSQVPSTGSREKSYLLFLLSSKFKLRINNFANVRDHDIFLLDTMLHVCNSISSRHMYHRLSSILFATIDFSRMTLSGGKVAAGGSQVMTAGVPIVNGGECMRLDLMVFCSSRSSTYYL